MAAGVVRIGQMDVTLVLEITNSKVEISSLGVLMIWIVLVALMIKRALASLVVPDLLTVSWLQRRNG